jgi:hypothetical protein
MTTSITLKGGLHPEEEQWLAKNIGPRMHYIHNSIGGQGWIARRNYKPGMVSDYWILTIEDDRHATFFSLMFPQ